MHYYVWVRLPSVLPKRNNLALINFYVWVRLIPGVLKLCDGVSVIWSLGATTQFTCKGGKHVVWVRLVPILTKLHVGASLVWPLGTTDKITYLSCLNYLLAKHKQNQLNSFVRFCCNWKKNLPLYISYLNCMYFCVRWCENVPKTIFKIAPGFIILVQTITCIMIIQLSCRSHFWCVKEGLDY